jgi:hypothetical protein
MDSDNDITMCAARHCTKSKHCYRHPASGTVPSKYQSWFMSPDMFHFDGMCDYYWSVSTVPTERIERAKKS